MRKKSVYTLSILLLLAVIFAVIYFNFIKSTEEVYEGTLVWERTSYEL